MTAAPAGIEDDRRLAFPHPVLRCSLKPGDSVRATKMATHDSQSKTYLVTLWLVLALLVLVAGATTRFVPQFEAVFSNFGTELPGMTQLVLHGTRWIWLLPLGAVGLLVAFFWRKRPQWAALLFLAALGAAWIPTAVVALYLPLAAHDTTETVNSESG
ncbi:MAG: hypothetical protein V2I57_15210 [Xanthomonadales bacterium]|nr:hypothetical protein [Xanthomonadales bacterium]